MKDLNDNQLKALEKIDNEIKKDVELAVEIAKNGSFMELMYFIYNLRTLRIKSVYTEEQGYGSAFIKTSFNQLEETIKYVIQILAKYITPEGKDERDKEMLIDYNLTKTLEKLCTLINSKYESKALIQLFDVELLDSDAKEMKLDTRNLSNNIDVKKFTDYYLRVDTDNNIKKNSKQNAENLISNFKDEYSPVEELFIKAFAININEFCNLILWFLDKNKEKVENAKGNFEYLENGNVQDQSIQTMMAFLNSFFVQISELEEIFGTKYNAIIDLLSFDPDLYDEYQLKFHLVTRSPLIRFHDFLVVSPELLLDSIFTNIHYSLLESSDVNEEYKAKQASLFIDKLVSLAKQYGFFEERREVDLYENKKQIGDIDLILKNDKDEYLLIEAKNHALPMDVYFKDIIKTQDHLRGLKEKWELKVLKRVKHLKDKHTDYDIPKSYQYIVVSRFPEIISHYSDLIILSLPEFEYWIKSDRWTNDFNVIVENFYQPHEANYSKEELIALSEAGLFLGKFNIE